MKRSVPLLLVFLLGVLPLFAEAKPDTVKSFSGDVLIDAFGNGAFIPVIKGDVLNGASVLKTGTNGRASIEVQGISHDIPPGAQVKISDYLAASAKKAGLGWFAAIGKLLKSFSEASSAQKQEDLPLGSRAADVSEGKAAGEMDWEVEETDAAQILPEARKNIEAGSYAAALEQLAKAEAPADPAVSWDLSFWKGFCYYQMEDYVDSAKHLSAAYSLMKSSKVQLGSPANRGTLLFQLGSSYFLLGQEKAAVPVLEAARVEPGGDRYAPYATLVLARALLGSGEAQRARSLAEESVKKYKGTDLEAEFASLLK